MHKPRTSILTLILAVYLGLRALLLLTSFDQNSLPVFELSPMGIIGRISSEGWRGAPLYAYYDNCGGHLLVGLMAAPLFKLLGPSYMVLKLIPLGLGVIDLLLIWDIARRLFGRRAAIFATLAFSLGAETLVVYSMLAKGNHFEGLTLQFLATWMWVRGYQSQAQGRWWTAAAFVSGAAISIYFGSTLWIGLLALTHWIVRGLRRGAIELSWAALPMAVGLAPIVWLELATGRPSNLLRTFLNDFQPVERLVALVFDVMPNAAAFSSPGTLSGQLANWALLLLFCVTWTVLFSVQFWRAQGGVEDDPAEPASRLKRYALVPFLAYLPLFILAYAVTTPRFDHYGAPIEVGQFRYLVPHFAFSCLLVGAIASWAIEGHSRWRRSFGTLLAIGPILIGALFALARVDWSLSHFGEGFIYDGYDNADIARPLLREESRDPATGRLSWDFERIIAELDEFEDVERKGAAHGLGRSLAIAQVYEKRSEGDLILDLGRILEPIPEELRPDTARGVGAALMHNVGYLRSLPQILNEFEQSSPEYAGYVAEGLSSPMRGRLSITTEEVLKRSQNQGGKIPPTLRVAWRRGQGHLCGDLLGRGFEEDERHVRDFLRALPVRAREAFWAGAEQSWNRSRRHNEVFAATRTDLEACFREDPMSSNESVSPEN